MTIRNNPRMIGKKAIKYLYTNGIRETTLAMCMYIRLVVEFTLIKLSPSLYKLIINNLNIITSINTTDADPIKKIYINPDNIVGVSGLRGKEQFSWVVDRGIVKSGVWDKNTKMFEYKSSYKYVDTIINGSNTPPTYNDRNKKEIADLYNSIKKNGYISQEKLYTTGSKSVVEQNNELVPTIFNEVTVDIGRDGQFYFRAYGQHRLCMAKLLNIEKIPVFVGIRHSEWQAKRNRIKDKDSHRDLEEDLVKYLDHPDIAQR